MTRRLILADEHNDPARPETRPDRFVYVSCAQCVACTFDRWAGKCLSGGPYNEQLEVDAGKLRAPLRIP